MSKEVTDNAWRDYVAHVSDLEAETPEIRKAFNAGVESQQQIIRELEQQIADARESSDAYSERLAQQMEQAVMNETRLREQLAARDAVIERVRKLPKTDLGMGNAGLDARSVCEILTAAPESVLADLIREKQAEAWSERGRDTFPFASKPSPYAEPGKLPTTGIIEYRKGAEGDE